MDIDPGTEKVGVEGDLLDVFGLAELDEGLAGTVAGVEDLLEVTPPPLEVKKYFDLIKKKSQTFPKEHLDKIYDVKKQSKDGFETTTIEANGEMMMDYLRKVHVKDLDGDGDPMFQYHNPIIPSLQKLDVPGEGSKDYKNTRKNLKQQFDRRLKKIHDIKSILEKKEPDSARPKTDDGGGKKPKTKSADEHGMPSEGTLGSVSIEKHVEVERENVKLREKIMKLEAADKPASASPSKSSSPIAASKPEQSINHSLSELQTSFESIDLNVDFDAGVIIEDHGLDFAKKILESYREGRELMGENDEKTVERDQEILTRELLTTCRKGKSNELVALLIEYGAKKDGSAYSMLHNGFSVPLLVAVEHNRREMVEFLLEKMEVDMNKRQEYKGREESAFTIAINKKHHDMATLLIEKGTSLRCFFFEPWWNPLSEACKANHVNLVKALMKEVGDNPKQRLEELCYTESSQGLGQMQLSGKNGLGELVEDVILMKNKDGTTALDVARQYCDDATIGLLLQVSPESPLFKLLKVAYKGEAKQLEVILDANPELNVNDREPKTGNTALFIASSQGKSQCVQYLLDRQADVNARNYDNCSPLVASVRNGSLEVTELLLECQNIDLDAFTKDSGFSALHFACSASRPDLAKLLLDKGADPNPEIMERPTKCDSPLSWAVCGRNLDLVKMLVEAKAEVKGQGLIELAKIYRSMPILQYLKEKGAD